MFQSAPAPYHPSKARIGAEYSKFFTQHQLLGNWCCGATLTPAADKVIKQTVPHI